LLQDQSASGALKYATVGSIAAAGSVSDLNSQTGSLTLTAGLQNSGATFSWNGQYAGMEYANCSLAASVSGGALTVALKDGGGSDPSATSPCIINFRSATATTGTVTTIYVTGALSFATGTSGSTFGSSNSTPFRLWITAINNAGTVVLGVSSQSVSTQVFPINEGAVVSSTACSACTNAASAGVFYTTSAQTSKAVRILGYMDWASGLGTAGTWASGPTTIQMFGPGVKKPGDVVQTIYASSTSQTANASGTSLAATTPAIAITPTAAPNLIQLRADGSFTASAGTGKAQIYRGSGCSTAVGALAALSTNGVNNTPVSVSGLDAPGTASSTTYQVCINLNVSGTSTWNNTATLTPTATISGSEIQGALPEPANDNIDPGVFSSVG